MFGFRRGNPRDPLELKLSRIKGQQAEVLRDIIDSIAELEKRQYAIEGDAREIRLGIETLKKIAAVIAVLIPIFTAVFEEAKERLLYKGNDPVIEYQQKLIEQQIIYEDLINRLKEQGDI